MRVTKCENVITATVVLVHTAWFVSLPSSVVGEMRLKIWRRDGIVPPYMVNGEGDNRDGITFSHPKRGVARSRVLSV